jgi:hypothetical protein
LRGIARSWFVESSIHGGSGPEVPGEIRVRQVDQRPDDPVARRGNPAEAARASTAEQPQQHRLGLVVGRVRNGHDVGVRASPRASRNA